jgi:hypothetical protein
MKNIYKTIFAGAIALTMASCSVSGPILVTDNPGGKSAKTGEASYKIILGFIRPMNADISIKKAAENGKITKISTVDSKVKGGLFVTTYSTIVTGE